MTKSDIWDTVLHRRRVLEYFVLFNISFLAIDIYVAHSINAFAHWAEWIPFYFSVVSVPVSNPTMETWTLAPSRIQSRSLSAKKMSPVSFICFSTSRFATPRIDWVASSPARLVRPLSISHRARSNQ